METDKVSEWYIAPCFVNGLEAYDFEINLALDEKLISNEYTVKLCQDYEDQLLDFNFDYIAQLDGEELLSFAINSKKAAKEAFAHRISQKFALLEEVRPVLEAMAYHDKSVSPP
nr:hypothetical protein [Tanacetum cinerariifolium]